MTSWVLSLQIRTQLLKSIQSSLRSTSQNWFRQQTINLRPLILPSGQVVPLFMYLKASRWIFRFKPTSVSITKRLPSLNVPLSSLMKVPAFTMLKDVQRQHTQRLAFMRPSLKSLHLMVPTCATQLSKTGQIASTTW